MAGCGRPVEMRDAQPTSMPVRQRWGSGLPRHILACKRFGHGTQPVELVKSLTVFWCPRWPLSPVRVTPVGELLTSADKPWSSSSASCTIWSLRPGSESLEYFHTYTRKTVVQNPDSAKNLSHLGRWDGKFYRPTFFEAGGTEILPGPSGPPFWSTVEPFFLRRFHDTVAPFFYEFTSRIP
jgi:hypothetical protein